KSFCSGRWKECPSLDMRARASSWKRISESAAESLGARGGAETGSGCSRLLSTNLSPLSCAWAKSPLAMLPPVVVSGLPFPADKEDATPASYRVSSRKHWPKGWLSDDSRAAKPWSLSQHHAMDQYHRPLSPVACLTSSP